MKILHPSSFILHLVTLLGVCSFEQAAAQTPVDRVRLVRGNESGEITAMTTTQVTVNKGAPGTRDVPVNEIKSVQFEGEPPELNQARIAAGNGNYQDALQLLGKIDTANLSRDFIKQEVEFYQALCAAKLALAGDREIGEAGRLLSSFIRANPQNFHNLAVVELMGDLLSAGGRQEDARKQYTKLATAPWPDYKMRAAVAIGRTLQAENKHAEAIQQFDAALAEAGDDADAANQRLAATLGKAVSLAETGGIDAAVEAIDKVILETDTQQKDLLARAYLAQGACFEKANRSKDALLAYLHVDMLYNTSPEAHAEALSRLVPLWKAVGQEEQSRQARELLTSRYGNTRWAKQLK